MLWVLILHISLFYYLVIYLWNRYVFVNLSNYILKHIQFQYMYTKNERHTHMSVFFANKNSILDISLQKNVTSKLILVLEVRYKSFCKKVFIWQLETQPFPLLIFYCRTFSRRFVARWWRQSEKNQVSTNQNSRNRWCLIVGRFLWLIRYLNVGHTNTSIHIYLNRTIQQISNNILVIVLLCVVHTSNTKDNLSNDLLHVMETVTLFSKLSILTQQISFFSNSMASIKTSFWLFYFKS